MHYFEQHKDTEKAILVHCTFKSLDFADNQNDLDEFRLLAISADAEILGEITGTMNKPSAKCFVGTGKADEIAQKVAETGAEIVLFNHTLTPSQERNLEKILQCKVIDRMGLILDIFAKRARTYEGKLQVELAQLTHLSSRLVRGYAHLGQQKGGIGLRGPGETQLETDRRLLQVRVNQLKDKLAKVKQTRQIGRAKRTKSSTPTISLVGYTNAGKSTLFNALTGENIYSADQLFATLDPTLRQIDWQGVGKVVLADTVGFVQNLPHELVESFHATLEETLKADLLLHIIDSSSPNMHEQIDAVNSVLHDIGATAPVLLVHNKIDKTKEKPTIHYKDATTPHRVYVSAHANLGINELTQAVQELLVGSLSYFYLTLPHHAGQLKNALHELEVITHSEFDETGHEMLTVRLAKDKLKELLGKYHLNAFDVLPPHEANSLLPVLEEFEKVNIKPNDDNNDELNPFYF
ncbi:GTPase HflX [Moraxella bovis]|uniref:ribosome rescue GTPase HflX n=1 Tax=Moraxella bovis TaxID=476 RepID=UPI002226392F|nr:ribosome rescue GTPase HflX [Moraxella bovis]UYZ67565.1 GTPase HflX [Moraxella bovis]UYZ69925.1 GTPase HflX [Moraxella bovis]UYZ74156.1 GTPase HflX [Moraxella bovis]UYZ90577.1 GTPase HflX [Moraxella bovis]UYZ94232.1 GTPase HflX [Moraxella bovis]